MYRLKTALTVTPVPDNKHGQQITVPSTRPIQFDVTSTCPCSISTAPHLCEVSILQWVIRDDRGQLAQLPPSPTHFP